MCQVMMHKSKTSIRCSEASSKRVLSVVLTGQAHIPPKQTRDASVIDGKVAFNHSLKIVANGYTDWGPSEADEVQLIWPDGNKVEAGADRKFGKSRVMLNATESLFGDREKDFPIPYDASRGIVHLRIIDSD